MARRLLIVVQEALFFTTHRLPVGRAMQRRGWTVHVAAPADAAIAARLESEGFVFHPIPLTRSRQNPLAELKLLLVLLGLCLRLRPDLLHLVSVKPVVWGGLVARLARLPGVVHAITGLGYVFIQSDDRADTKTGLLRQLIERLYRLALGYSRSIAIFQNPDDLAVFEARGMVPADRWVMIKGCGVDMQVFAEQPEPTIDAEHPPVVMFPARLLGDKGVREFVTAAEILRAEKAKESSRARFVLVGRRDPDNKTDIGAEQLQAWIDAGTVEYWGFAADMPAVLARGHIIVLPSYREGLPRGLIEAAAIGRAIVTTDAPGCREVVRHEENGLLVPVGDGKATADAIRRLLNDPALRHRMAAASRAIAVGEFSVEQFVAASLQTYDRVLQMQGKRL